MACDVSRSEGHCAPVPSGAPHGTHTPCVGAGTTCGGSCTGRQDGACQYPTGACGTAMCSTTDTVVPQGACGAGTCSAATPTKCSSGTICSNGGCKSMCSSNSDCQGGYFCQNATCKLLKAVQVVCGQEHSCALLSDSSVRCWGDNSLDELGNASAGASSIDPVVVTGLSGVSKLDGGVGSTCALMSDNTVRCWGDGFDGLGNGSTGTNSATPVMAQGLIDAVAVSAGRSYFCAIRQGGTVECWGSLPFVAPSATPVTVPGISGVTAIDVGSYHACAISAGKVYCWGANSHGELGQDPTQTTSSPSPLMVPGITAFSLSSGFEFSCVLRTAGPSGIACWGDQSGAVSGMGPFPYMTSNVAGIGDAISLCTGVAHVCAATASGSVKCWGDNSRGALGLDMSRPSVSSPSDPVPGVSNVLSLACGDFHTCAVTSDGAVHCWGYNASGQLGTTPVTTAPYGTSTPSTISNW
jgi:alpha-tubulin suppressor-like RCC1 family protein